MENKMLSPLINGIRYNIINKDDVIQSQLLKGKPIFTKNRM